MVLSSWRRKVLPLHLLIVELVPEMNYQPFASRRGPAPTPAVLSIVQHNCLGSSDVFLFLLELFSDVATYPSIVLLQELPVSQAPLSSFRGFKSFFPSARKPRLARADVQNGFLSAFSVLPRFKRVDDVIALDVSSQCPLFDSDFHSFRPFNAYSTNPRDHCVYSVLPESLFLDVGIPFLVVGDLNIHKPRSDPPCSDSPRENPSSTAYFEKVSEAGFALLNPPGEYTLFPLVGTAHPSVIALAFANPLLLPWVKGREGSLPSTGSDHIPITINQALPTLIPVPRRPQWSDTDWETMSPIIKEFQISTPHSASPRRTWTGG